jgi:hypothetical protein
MPYPIRSRAPSATRPRLLVEAYRTAAVSGVDRRHSGPPGKITRYIIVILFLDTPSSTTTPRKVLR